MKKMTWPNWQKIKTVCKINLQALDLKSTENFSKAFLLLCAKALKETIIIFIQNAAAVVVVVVVAAFVVAAAAVFFFYLNWFSFFKN